eukprot:9482639-Alexandrium_andersonii.AAC.1
MLSLPRACGVLASALALVQLVGAPRRVACVPSCLHRRRTSGWGAHHPPSLPLVGGSGAIRWETA